MKTSPNLAERSRQAQSDFAAGRISDRDLLWIILDRAGHRGPGRSRSASYNLELSLIRANQIVPSLFLLLFLGPAARNGGAPGKSRNLAGRAVRKAD